MRPGGHVAPIATLVTSLYRVNAVRRRSAEPEYGATLGAPPRAQEFSYTSHLPDLRETAADDLIHRDPRATGGTHALLRADGAQAASHGRLERGEHADA